MDESAFRDFMREQTLRHEQASREMQRSLRALERRTDAEIEELRIVERRTDEMVRRGDVMIEALRDLVAESQAQRRALLALVDRLPPPATA